MQYLKKWYVALPCAVGGIEMMQFFGDKAQLGKNPYEVIGYALLGSATAIATVPFFDYVCPPKIRNFFEKV